MAIWAAVIGAGASLLGSALSSSQSASNVASTNSQNLQINRETRDWSQMMSATAEQRHVEDLQKAGLNPALAYQTAAPVPGTPGQIPMQAPPPSGVGPGLGQAAQTAMQMYNAKLQSDSVKAQTDKTKVDTATAASQLPFAGATAQANLNSIQYQSDKVFNDAQILSQKWQVSHDMSQAELQQLQQNVQFQKDMQQLQIQAAKLDIQRQQLGMPRLENDAAAQKTWWMKAIAPYLGSMDTAVNTASKAVKMIPP